MSKSTSMTGRELMIYILQNHLEDEPIFENGKIVGFINEQEAALKFGVGTATIRVWANCGMIPAIVIADRIYIPAKAEPVCVAEKE